MSTTTATATTTLDLESYASRYSGATRLQRLLLIAKTVPDDVVAQQAFDLAEQQMRQDGNVRQYKEVFGSGSSSSNPATSITTAAGSSSGEQPEEQRPPPAGEAEAAVAIVAEESQEVAQQQPASTGK